MVITKISASKNRKDLYQIFIDGKFFCSISGNDLLETRLTKGAEINNDQIDGLLYRSLKGKLSNSALNYLAIRPHSELEIKRFLKKKLYTHIKETSEYKDLNTEQIIEEIIENLKIQTLVNDEDFAKWLITNRTSAKNPKSKASIRMELQKKGVSGDITSSYLENFDNNKEIDQAKLVAERKLSLLRKRESDYNQLKIKLSRYLISKGYTWETVRTTVDSLLKPF